MQLPDAEVKLFYKLYHPLLLYTAQKTQQVKNVSLSGEIRQIPFEKLNDIRSALYGQVGLIDSFVAENPLAFSKDELDIISGWKNFVKDTFYIVRYLKDYAVFLTGASPAKAYGVRALYSTFEEVVGPILPIMVEAILLPFQGKIIYDGLVAPYRISFGAGIRRNLNEAYQRAKAQHGIITSFDMPVKQQSDAELLKFYLRNQASREEYAGEIYDLIHKDKSLLLLYHQEMGKISATSYKRHLRELGFKNAWFGILDGMIVVGGATKQEVERIAQEIVPPDKRELLYVFQFKAK
ncbi:MAG: hypothetical protein ONB44_01195 [candidate division KSB1 bacterium]|nr:hypothetical protein [candidate division KSB1 bacterium]MDZ7300736.1 hypothetical protein [candidate division KSB1 bacterium]